MKGIFLRFSGSNAETENKKNPKIQMFKIILSSWKHGVIKRDELQEFPRI